MRYKLAKMMFCTIVISAFLTSESASAQEKQKSSADTFHVATGSVHFRKLPDSISEKRTVNAPVLQKRDDVKIDTSKKHIIKERKLINPSFYNRWISKSQTDSSNN